MRQVIDVRVCDGAFESPGSGEGGEDATEGPSSARDAVGDIVGGRGRVGKRDYRWAKWNSA